METKEVTRKSKQEIMPQKINKADLLNSSYNLYPSHALGAGKISSGYASLAGYLASHKIVKVDGYIGVDWENLINRLTPLFLEKGIRVHWIRTEDFLHSKEQIDQLVQPFLGTEGSVWGKNTDLELADFFRMEELTKLETNQDADLTIIIGVGAALTEITTSAELSSTGPATSIPLIYLDLPKNELLYRMRAGAIFNLGNDQTEDIPTMYKRFYFVDWVVSNKHKETLLNQLTALADAQWADNISWIFADDLFEGIRKLSTSVFRPRPWFDPGVWGGQWMKEHIEALDRDESNYAWSFEIIAPENGVVFESDGKLLEVSFDTLMFKESQAILGRHAERFGNYFPIRFDFLDTFDGGNLSIQCHPSLPYIQKQFGEQYTQDETYYLLDCKPGAEVYLGFQEDIDPHEFRKVLKDSVRDEKEIDVKKYVQTFHSNKHDFFLIPNQTVHSSGKNNMVLEISATPYIFTFKMYDWLQRDSQGKPRPINIEHAFNNLDFKRKGKRVIDELISKPAIIEEGADWKLIHLPTHAEHYYDVHRIEFDSTVRVTTNDACHILMLVEGTAIEIETEDGTKTRFNYAETFIVPAHAGHYTLRNLGTGTAKLVKAFVK